MFKNLYRSSASLFILVAMAGAEPQRAFLTTENKFPSRGALELGYEYAGREFEALTYDRHALVARYGLIENLTVRVHAPYDTYETDFGDKESGIGDVILGLDLVAYQDVFSFPFVIPHIDLSFPTGDEEAGLSSGDTMIRAGFAVGTKTHEQFMWIADFSYAHANYEVASEEADLFEIGLSWIWELSDRFTVNLEGLYRHAESNRDDSVLLGAGMTYKWTPEFQTGAFLGQWNDEDSGEEQIINVTAAYGI